MKTQTRQIRKHEEEYLHISWELIRILCWIILILAIFCIVYVISSLASQYIYQKGYKVGRNDMLELVISGIDDADCKRDITIRNNVEGGNETTFKIVCPEFKPSDFVGIGRFSIK